MNLELSTQPLGREQAFPDTEDTSPRPTRKIPEGSAEWGLWPPQKRIRQQMSGGRDWAGVWGMDANGTGFLQGDDDVLELVV